MPGNRSIDQVLGDVAKEVIKDDGESRPGDQSSNEERAAAAKAPDPTRAAPKAAPPIPDKKSDAAPADEIAELPVAPEGMSKANKAHWDKLREASQKQINEEKNRAAALAAKLKTYETATPADTERATRLEAQLKEAQDSLAVYNLKSHPDFKRQYVEPKEKALSEAKMLLADNGVSDAPDMAALLAKPRVDFAKTVSELASKLPAFDQGSLVASMREAYRLHGEENNALSRSAEMNQQLASKAAAQARQGFEESKNEFVTRIQELAIPEGADEAKVAEVTAFNKARQEALQEMEKMTFGKMTEREVAAVAARAATTNLFAHHVLPAVQRELKRSNELLAEATAELAAIKSKKNPGTFAGPTERKAAPRQNNGSTTPDFSGVAQDLGMR